MKGLCLAFALVLPVAANDTLVTLGAGGLVPAKSTAISMESEELEISVHEIAVKYVFGNASSHDEDLTVAFPLPPINGGDVANEPMNIPSKDPLNFIDFRVIVGGRPVEPRVEVRAFFEDREITGELRRLGLPLSVLDGNVTAAVKKLAAADRARIQKEHWVDCALTPDGKCWPYWQSRIQYYWTQRFPAGAAVEIRHTYRPVVGGSFVYPSGGWKESIEPYCGGADVLQSIAERNQRRGGKDQDKPLYDERRIQYILTTGANWKEPIHDFHLTVNSDGPDDLVMTCMTGLRQMGRLRYELALRDFRPAKDLDLLILQPTK